MSPTNPVPPQKKRLSPLVIVLIVIGGFVMLGGLLLVAGGMFVLHKAKQAGFDSSLLESNPALAVTKLLAAINPDVEVVRVDDASGKIELRDKNTGETVLVDFEDIKKGKISFASKEGKVTVGAGGKVPSWAPVYPGAEQNNVLSSQTDEGHGYTLHQSTADSPEQVVKFFKEKLEAAGFKVEEVPHPVGSMLAAKNEKDGKNVSVMIGQAAGKTTIGATFIEK